MGVQKIKGICHIETMMYLSYINLTYGILLTLMREMNDRNDIFANTFEVNQMIKARYYDPEQIFSTLLSLVSTIP